MHIEKHWSVQDQVSFFASLLQDASGHSNVLKQARQKSRKMLGKGELPEKPTS